MAAPLQLGHNTDGNTNPIIHARTTVFWVSTSGRETFVHGWQETQLMLSRKSWCHCPIQFVLRLLDICSAQTVIVLY